MKIIVSPSVHLLSASQFFAHPKYRLPPDGSGAERLIATAGKVCYDSYGEDGHPVCSHVLNLVNQRHESVLEHVHVGLFIEGISRGCSHEIVRHRMFNYSQRSTRYTSEEDAAIVLDPMYAKIHAEGGTPEDTALLRNFITSCEGAFNDYSEAVVTLTRLAPVGSTREMRKWARGKARQLLPHALETRMVMTGNLRAWRHFFLMRTSRHAEAEIRRLAATAFPIVEQVAPSAFADIAGQEVNGFLELTCAS